MNPGAGEPPAWVYRSYLESGVLAFQRCAGCGAAIFYPRVLCPYAGAMIFPGRPARAGGRLVTGSEADPCEAPYNPRYPVSMYALASARHMHEYGTTRGQLAEVAVAARSGRSSTRKRSCAGT
jgi:hypothetical protein